MDFVCDRSGPVPPAEVGLRNNPESSHLRPELQRHIAAWNLLHPERELRLFEANNRFPVERWDPLQFALLPFALAAPGPAGPGVSGYIAHSIKLNGISHGDGAGDSRIFYLNDGTPYHSSLIEIPPFTGSTFGAPHNITGGLISNQKLIDARAVSISTDSNFAWSRGFPGGVRIAMKNLQVTDTQVFGEILLAIASPFLRIRVIIDHI